MSKKDKNLTDQAKTFPELLSMNEDRTALLISLLIKFEEEVDRVKIRFDKTAEKKISLEAINQIRLQYKDRIRAGIERRKNDLSKCKYGTEREQLIALGKLFDDAMDPKGARKWERVDVDRMEQRIGTDPEIAIKAMAAISSLTKASKQRELELRKLALKKEITGKSGTDPEDEEEEEGSSNEEDDYKFEFGSA